MKSDYGIPGADLHQPGLSAGGRRSSGWWILLRQYHVPKLYWPRVAATPDRYERWTASKG